MGNQSNNLSCKKKRCFTKFFIYCFFVVIGVLMMNMLCCVGKDATRRIPTVLPSVPKPENPPNTPQPFNEEQLQVLSKQLINQVTDTSNHLTVLLRIFSFITVVVGIILGGTIWKTKDYAKHVINSYWEKNREEKITPFSEDIKRDLKNIADAALTGFLKAHEIVWDSIHRQKDEKYKVYQCAICLMANSKDEVINAAQYLGKLGDTNSIKYLQDALDRWPSGDVRSEVQRAIDKIKQKSETTGT